MNKTAKIVLGVVLPLVAVGGYWFIYRNRQPSLDLDETDWINNKVVVKFGRNKQTVSLGDSGEMNAGMTFNTNLYKLEFKSSGKNVVFLVKDKDGNTIEKQTLDFGAKIKY
jgi:hypothetical protein